MISRLDHIAEMGFNTVLVMPIWDGPTGHGYACRSLRRVEADFGTDEDFRELVAACHRRGLRLMVDFNDTTTFTGHPLFGQAVLRENSPFRHWINWTSPVHYTAYTLGGDVLDGPWPQFNYDSPQLRRYMVEMLTHWVMEFGVDGFRMDSVERIKPGPNHGWWRVLRRELKRLNPELALLGEVYGRPQDHLDRELDVVYDHQANESLKGAITGEISALQARQVLESRIALDPTGTRLLRYLSNHDSDRWLTTVGGNRDRAELGLVALLTLPGVPAVYYGCEAEMTGGGLLGGGTENREPMEWDNLGGEMHRLIRTLTHLSLAEPALRNEGTCEFLDREPAEDLLVALRRSRAVPPSSDFVVALNFSEEAHDVALPPGDWELALGSPERALPSFSYAVWRGRAGD
jgi:glycosidase